MAVQLSSRTAFRVPGHHVVPDAEGMKPERLGVQSADLTSCWAEQMFWGIGYW